MHMVCLVLALSEAIHSRTNATAHIPSQYRQFSELTNQGVFETWREFYLVTSVFEMIPMNDMVVDYPSELRNQ